MKLYVLFSVLVLGILGWIIVEVRHRRKVSFAIGRLISGRNHPLTRHFNYRRLDFVPSRRTARAPHRIPELPPCPRPTTNTTSWRRTLWSHTCKSCPEGQSESPPFCISSCPTRVLFPTKNCMYCVKKEFFNHCKSILCSA